MLERWRALHTRMAAEAAPETVELHFAIVAALYERPPRAYHTLGHVAACLDRLAELRAGATDADAVEYALWLHDSVYFPERRDNEARSAAVAELLLRDVQTASERVADIRELILATRHAGPATRSDAALIADIDLTVLGAAPAEYDRYAAAIRAEYAFADDADYREGRSRFLRGFLSRPALFSTPECRRRFEAAARSNLARELAALGYAAGGPR